MNSSLGLLRRLLIFGAPGSGKGTQGKILEKMTEMRHISTGQLLRDENLIANLEPDSFREYVQAYLVNGYLKGEFLSDGPMIRILDAKLKESNYNFILDGFPRTIEQAHALNNSVDIQRAVLLETNVDEIVKRIPTRLTCGSCQQTYNTSTPQFMPKVQGQCDYCPGTLKIREDDRNPKTVRDRINVYNQKTKLVLDIYEPIILRVDASGEPRDVAARILKGLDIDYLQFELDVACNQSKP